MYMINMLDTEYRLLRPTYLLNWYRGRDIIHYMHRFTTLDMLSSHLVKTPW